MKHLNYILYGAAFILIITPIVMTEAFHNSLSLMGQTTLFTIGALLLIIGKVLSIQKKRKETGESFFLDIVIILCLVVMIIWMFLKL